MIFTLANTKDVIVDALSTFYSLRQAIGVLALLFPLLGLWGLSCHIQLQGSLSAYYHAVPGDKSNADVKPPATSPEPPGCGALRNMFVGCLWAIGTLLWCAIGFGPWEKVLFKIAGFFAICTAIVPMEWQGQYVYDTWWGHLHLLYAFTFVFCIGCVATFNPDATATALSNQEKSAYRLYYRIAGWFMIGGPIVTAIVFSCFPGLHEHMTYALELVSAWAFGFYWCIKDSEVKKIADAYWERHKDVFRPPSPAVQEHILLKSRSLH